MSKAAPLLAILVAGCVSGPAMDYILAEYKGTEPQAYQQPDDTYRIFDKPAANKLMITPSIGRSMGMGAASGATFGAVDDSHNIAPYRAAAEAFLKTTKSEHCRVTTATLLIRPQYEIRYDCTAPAVASASDRRGEKSKPARKKP